MMEPMAEEWAVSHTTPLTDAGVVYGVRTTGVTELSAADLSTGSYFQIYYPVLQNNSEVIICGIKDL